MIDGNLNKVLTYDRSLLSFDPGILNEIMLTLEPPAKLGLTENGV